MLDVAWRGTNGFSVFGNQAVNLKSPNTLQQRLCGSTNDALTQDSAVLIIIRPTEKRERENKKEREREKKLNEKREEKKKEKKARTNFPAIELVSALIPP